MDRWISKFHALSVNAALAVPDVQPDWITDQLFVYFGEQHKGAKYRLNYWDYKNDRTSILESRSRVSYFHYMPLNVCYGYRLDGCRMSATQGYLWSGDTSRYSFSRFNRLNFAILSLWIGTCFYLWSQAEECAIGTWQGNANVDTLALSPGTMVTYLTLQTMLV